MVTCPLATGSWGSVYAARAVTASYDAAEVALKFLPTGTMTPRSLSHLSVNSHIKYLADTKLIAVSRSGPSSRGGRTQSLVAVALGFDVVREEHLALLPRVRPPVHRPPAH